MRRVIAVLALSVVSAPAQAATPALDGARSAVVTIVSDAGEGSGFYISASEIITAAHVVGDQEDHVIVGGSSATEDATVERVSHGLDLALIRTPEAGTSMLALENAPPAIGEAVFAARSDVDGFSVSRGIVSAIRTKSGVEYVQTDAAVNPGNSGGPLLNESGEVVGVVQSKRIDSEGVALAITASTLQSFIAGTAAEPASRPELPKTKASGAGTRWQYLLLLAPFLAFVYLVRTRPREIKIRLKNRTEV